MGRYGGAFAARPDAADTSAEAKEQRVVAMFPANALPATTFNSAGNTNTGPLPLQLLADDR